MNDTHTISHRSELETTTQHSSTTPVVYEGAPPPAVHQPNNAVQPHFLQQHVPPGSAPPTFWQTMRTYMILGFSISLGMGLVSVLFSVAFSHETETQVCDREDDYVDALTDAELEEALSKVSVQ
jgi:hypothetical protein